MKSISEHRTKPCQAARFFRFDATSVPNGNHSTLPLLPLFTFVYHLTQSLFPLKDHTHLALLSCGVKRLVKLKIKRHFHNHELNFLHFDPLNICSLSPLVFLLNGLTVLKISKNPDWIVRGSKFSLFVRKQLNIEKNVNEPYL